MKLHNHFDIFIEKATGIEKVGHAENVVLDTFYTSLNKYTLPVISYIHVGVGTTAPAVTNTGLASSLDKRVAIVDLGDYNESEKYFTKNMHVEYGTTEFNGCLISEVGLGDGSNLYTRALIMDNNGNPISIEKKPTERLIVYATVYVYRETYPAGHEMLQGIGVAYAMGAGMRDQAMALASGGFGYISEGVESHVYCDHYLKGNGLCKYIAFGNYSASSYVHSPGSRGIIKTASLSGLEGTSTLGTSEAVGKNLFGVVITSSGSYVPANSTKRNFFGIIRDVDLLNVSNLSVVVGTGDGIKTKFNLKHFGAKNIKCLVNGIEDTSVSIKNAGISEAVPTIDANLIDFLNIDYSNGNESSVSEARKFALSEPIPYLDGYIKITDRHFHANKLFAIYYHIVSDELFVEFIELDAPVEIPCSVDAGFNVPTGIAHSGAGMPILLPDKSGLIFIYNGTTKIFKYNSVTGIIGSLLYDMPITKTLFFTPDMLHAMTYSLFKEYSSEVGDNISNPMVTLYDVVRTADTISLTTINTTPIHLYPHRQYTDSCILWAGGKDTLLVKDQFKVYTNHYATTFKINWAAATVSLAIVPDITNYATGNYFVARKPTDTSIQIGKRNVDDTITWLNTITDATLAGCDIRTLVDTEDHIHILWQTVNYLSGSTPKGIMLQVVDNVAYSVFDCVAAGTTPYWNKFSIGAFNFIEYSRKIPIITYPANQYIEFSTPPTAGATIGAQYDLDYLPKDENWTVSAKHTITNQRG